MPTCNEVNGWESRLEIVYRAIRRVIIHNEHFAFNALQSPLYAQKTLFEIVLNVVVYDDNTNLHLFIRWVIQVTFMLTSLLTRIDEDETKG